MNITEDPNPFNPSTTIEFSVPATSFISIEVFNILGKRVTSLISEWLSPGTYATKWNAEGLASGTYFCRMQSKAGVTVKRMMLLR